MTAAQRHKSYAERFHENDIFSLKCRRTRGNLNVNFKAVKVSLGLIREELLTIT